MTTQGSTDSKYSPMQAVKRHFFAMRNGIIADTLRKAGSPYRFIFGLNLPQIVETAQMFGPDRDLAEALWANSATRESMLLAPMMMPSDGFSVDDARRWAATVPDTEAADILCHRLLRHLPFAAELAAELARESRTDMERYTAGRLALNLFYTVPDAARQVAALLQVNAGPLAAAMARRISERFEDI